MLPRLNSSTRGVTRASKGSISFLASRSNSRAKKMKCFQCSIVSRRTAFVYRDVKKQTNKNGEIWKKKGEIDKSGLVLRAVY